MHIAICDNEKKDLEILKKIISEFALHSNKEVSLSSFDNAQHLLTSIESGTYYNLILFDILMPELNGIDAAKIIRKSNTDTKIVFTTTSRDFAIDAFAVKATDYLLKPISSKMLFPILEEIETLGSQGVMIQTKFGLKKIMPSKLLYGEVRGHIVLWHFITGAIIESRDSMTNVLNMISKYGNFLKIHRSFFINLDLVTEFSKKDVSVTLNGNIKLYIPRAKYAEIYSKYVDYQKGGGLNEK